MTIALQRLGFIFKSFLLFVAIEVYPQFTVCQPSRNHGIDSLSKLLSNALEDTNKVKLIYELAKLYPEYDPNKGLEVAKMGLQLSETLNWKRGIVLCYLGMGFNECSRADFKSAEKCLDSGIKQSDGLNDYFLACMLHQYMAIAYYDECNYPEALKYFLIAIDIDKNIQNSKLTFILLEYIGRVYEAQKNFVKAREYYQMSYDKATRAGEIKAKEKNEMNIGQVYQQMGKFSQAKQCFNDALAGFKALNDDGGVAVSLADLGSVENELHEYVSALRNDFDACSIYLKYADRENIAATYGNIGKTYLTIVTDTTGTILPDSLSNRKANIQKVFYYLDKARDLYKSLSDLDGLSVIYSQLSTANELSGKYDDALKTYKSFITLRDSIYSSDNNIKIANLEMNQEIAVRDHELRLKQLELAKRRNENIFFIMGICLLLFITIILFRNNSTQKKLNATITKLVNEQEETIAERTEALVATNKKLVDLIQFNVHNIREPITRIMGLIMLKEDMEKVEFVDACLPRLEQSVNDLDDILRKVVKTAEETAK